MTKPERFQDTSGCVDTVSHAESRWVHYISARHEMPYEITKCLICGSRDSRKSGRATRILCLPETYHVRRCRDCRFLWLNPQPTEEEYEQIYDESYFTNPQDPSRPSDIDKQYPLFEHDYENQVVPERRQWYRHRLQTLKIIRPNANSILDVGAGTGEFLDESRRLGWRIAGVEFSKYACARADEKYGIAMQCGNIESLRSMKQKFDVIHLSHVFEHVTQPRRALRILQSLMTDESLLVIEVPNQFNSPVETIYRWKTGRRKCTLHSIHHPFFYTPTHLSRLVRQCGYSEVAMRTWFPERCAASWMKRLMGLVDATASKVWNKGFAIELVARKSSCEETVE